MGFRNDFRVFRQSDFGGLVLMLAIMAAIFLAVLAATSWYWFVIVVLVAIIFGGMYVLARSVIRMVTREDR